MKLLNNIPKSGIKVAAMLLGVLTGFAGSAQTGVRSFDGAAAIETIKGEHFAIRNQAGATVRIRKSEVAAPIAAKGMYRVSAEANMLNRGGFVTGVQNVFANVAEGGNSERIDYIAPGGFTVVSAAKEGFVIADAGSVHEGFCVAAITAVDNAGEPTAFSKILKVTSGTYGPETAGTAGVLIRFADLGIASGNVVYGYAVLASDMTGTLAAAWNTYPSQTSMADGGLDMIGIAGFFVMSDRVAPIATDAEVTTLGTQPVRVKGGATSANGQIAYYTIVKVPKLAEGFLCYTEGNNVVPASIGKQLSTAQMKTLTFCGVADFSGDAEFEYSATNDAGLISNTAFGTVHVQPVTTTSMEPAVRIQKEGVKF